MIIPENEEGLMASGTYSQGGRDITEMETEFYYGYYGTFLKDFIDSEPRPPQKAPKTLIFEKNLEKPSRFITDITEIAITEY